MIMDTLFLKLAAAILIVAASSCQKNIDGTEDGQDGTSSLRPQDLVTDSYIAFPSGSNACVDSYLTMEFRSAPHLGKTGEIRILDADGDVVDLIRMEDIAALSDGKPQMTAESVFTTAMDAIGSSALGYYRIVYYEPVTVEGNTVTIRLHSDKLEFGKEYRVDITEDALTAEGFDGVSGGEWSFTVMEQPGRVSEVTVGSRDCDFMTVQGAVNFANLCGQSHAMTISVSEGIYEEQLYIRNKNKLTIKGAAREKTIIRYDNCNDYINGVGSGVPDVPETGGKIGKAGGRSVILVENCDMLRFENISVENTHGHGSQAEALYFNSDDGRLVAVDCSFSGEQDTLELKGWCLFRDCKVTGDVDFIWGYARAALFESCEIRSCENSNGGYIVQARCSRNSPGFVFLDCNITADSGVDDGTVYLARSGGSGDYYDNVTYVNCRMGAHIAGAGWYPNPGPNPSEADERNGWKEYGSKGTSGWAMDVSDRLAGSIQLEASDVESLYKDAATVFADCPDGTDWVL